MDGEPSGDLDFEPTKLEINQEKGCFVVYGEKGILVGNFPALLQNMVNSREEQQDERLVQPGRDLVI